MKVIRTFNNNVISAWTDDKKEIIVIGSGIGFQKKSGDIVDESKIEKKYILDTEEIHRFNQLYNKTRFEYFDVAEEVYSRAKEEFNYDIGNQTMIALVDHISFAIERAKKGVTIPNFLLSEIQVLYEKEYQFGTWAIGYISEQTGISFPNDEAGYIAMHLINSSMNYEVTAAEIINISTEIKNIIFSIYEITLKPTDLDYSRLTTHLKYLAQRIVNEQEPESSKLVDDKLYSILYDQDPRMKDCFHLINNFLSRDYNRKLSEKEELYIMIHILKILSNH